MTSFYGDPIPSLAPDAAQSQPPTSGTQQRLADGEPVVFQLSPQGVESWESYAARRVAATWLMGLVELPSRTVSHAIRIVNAAIEGDIDLSYTTFLAEVTFSGCEFLGIVNLSYSSFHRGINLEGCQFRHPIYMVGCHISPAFLARRVNFASGFSFTGLQVDGNLFFDNSQVYGEAAFQKVTIDGDASLRGVHFYSTATFHRLYVKGITNFNSSEIGPTIFWRDSNFSSTHFTEDAFFNGAQFREIATFIGMDAERNVVFMPDGSHRVSIFFKGAIFFHAYIHGSFMLVGLRAMETLNLTKVHTDTLQITRGSEGERSCFFGKVELSGAVIDSDVLVFGARFYNSLVMINADFRGNIHLSGDEEASMWFFGVVEGLRSRITGTVSISYVVFANLMRWQDADFGGDLICQGVEFLRGLDLRNAEIRGSARFFPATENGRTVFEGAVDFSLLKVREEIRFVGVEFTEAVSFLGTDVGWDFLFERDAFGRPVVFIEPVLLDGAHVTRSAQFGGAIFAGSASLLRFKGDAEVQFGSETSENRAAILGRCDLSGSQFGSGVNGVGVRFESALDAAGVKWNGPVALGGLRCSGNASFRGAVFDGELHCDNSSFDGDADWSGARLTERATFANTTFHGSFDFSYASAEKDVDFREAVFNGASSFRDAHISNVSFRSNAAASQFPAGVDLRGFSCETAEVDWTALLRQMEPHNRSAYALAERILRGESRDREADSVYLSGRSEERKKLRWSWHEWPNTLRDNSYWIVANYGVRPVRLAVLTIVLLMFGSFIFSRPLAVSMKANQASGAPSPSASLTRWQAIGMSVNQLLPVDIPAGSQWKASENHLSIGRRETAFTFSTYATIQHLLGWVLVPLGVASLTGLLFRRPSA